MSRLDGRYTQVTLNSMAAPAGFTISGERSPIAVTGVVEHFREWIGVLDGELERDVWRVDTPHGTCELHHLKHPCAEDAEPQGEWILFRWED